MSLKITDDCIACGACVSACPVEAITEGDPIFIINPERCVECVGFFDESQCAAVCPVEACVPDAAHPETKEELLTKKKNLGF